MLGTKLARSIMLKCICFALLSFSDYLFTLNLLYSYKISLSLTQTCFQVTMKVLTKSFKRKILSKIKFNTILKGILF